MNNVDATLVRLAVPLTRGVILDSAALERVTLSAYDGPALALTGPFTATWDEWRMGFVSPRRATISGGWSKPGCERYDALLTVTGLGTGPIVRVDALWRGSINARVIPASDPIEKVSVALPSIRGIDADIVTSLGALPTNATTLEAERRTRYRARLAADLNQPATLTDALLDALLASVGAQRVSDLFASPGTAVIGSLRVQFAAPRETTPSPRALPIAAAVFVRPAGFSLADLLWETRLTLQELEEAGFGAPVVEGLTRLRPVAAIWVVPADVFDDVAWPGGEGAANAAQARALRIIAASAWLAREGIALAPVA